MIAAQIVQETEPDHRSEGENIYLPHIIAFFLFGFFFLTFAHGKWQSKSDYQNIIFIR